MIHFSFGGIYPNSPLSTKKNNNIFETSFEIDSKGLVSQLGDYQDNIIFWSPTCPYLKEQVKSNHLLRGNPLPSVR